jgi:hypothetical protein
MSIERVRFVEFQELKYKVIVDNEEVGTTDIDFECSLIFIAERGLTPVQMKLIADAIEMKGTELFEAGLLG